MAQETFTESEAGPQYKDILLDDRYESYERFFDHDWAKQFLGLTEATRIDNAALDLCVDWKGAASIASMPWLLIHTLEQHHKGYMQRDEPFWKRLTRLVREHILTKMAGSYSNMKRKELGRIIDELGLKVEDEMSRRPSELSSDNIWKGYLKIHEFRLSLWSSQRISYGALYHGYENFLRRFISIHKPEREGALTRISDVRDDLKQIFGVAEGGDFLDERAVHIARLVRNALAHNGGRPCRELLGMESSLTIQGNLIHIQASEVRQLFDLLKGKVLLIAKKAPAVPRYRLT